MSKTQLDISIKSADKHLINSSRITELLNSEITIEHKTDGVKLNIHKLKNNGNLDDYIFSYKGNILYKDEHNYDSLKTIKTESIGASQFRTVFEHFEQLNQNSIPIGTELFIEFLMRKPTLSSNYTELHKMILIGYAESSYTECFGKIKSSPDTLQTLYREIYAKILEIDTPELLFAGEISSKSQFISGIKNNELRESFNSISNDLNFNSDKELLIKQIKNLFLSVLSKYGGLEEGVILKYNSNILKWQQNYQLDQSARMLIKQKYREDSIQLETEYWNNVKVAAHEISNSVITETKNILTILSELSDKLKTFRVLFAHTKKTTHIIKTDIQLNAKLLLIKRLNGNNNALIIGKFRVLTTEGHVKLINQANKLYDNVCICVVTSKDTKDTKDVRTKMIQTQFPQVEIIHAVNGNLIRILQKTPMNINAVYAGSDRVQGYRDQLRNTVGVQVKELHRTDSDISASKILDNIKNREFFETHTPKNIHGFYGKLK